jgi:hypothetical protein
METNVSATKPARNAGGSQSPSRYGAASVVRPTHEQIAARAKAIWQAKGCPAGKDDENWREAEEQLRHGR